MPHYVQFLSYALSFFLNDCIYNVNVEYSQQLNEFGSFWQAIYLLAASTLGVEPSRYLMIVLPK